MCNEILDRNPKLLVLPIVGINLKEIVIQNVTDSQKDIGRYPGTFEDVIYILPRIIQLSGKPHHRPFLTGEFLSDEMSDMWCFVRGHAPEISK